MNKAPVSKITMSIERDPYTGEITYYNDATGAEITEAEHNLERDRQARSAGYESFYDYVRQVQRDMEEEASAFMEDGIPDTLDAQDFERAALDQQQLQQQADFIDRLGLNDPPRVNMQELTPDNVYEMRQLGFNSAQVSDAIERRSRQLDEAGVSAEERNYRARGYVGNDRYLSGTGEGQTLRFLDPEMQARFEADVAAEEQRIRQENKPINRARRTLAGVRNNVIDFPRQTGLLLNQVTDRIDDNITQVVRGYRNILDLDRPVYDPKYLPEGANPDFNYYTQLLEDSRIGYSPSNKIRTNLMLQPDGRGYDFSFQGPEGFADSKKLKIQNQRTEDLIAGKKQYIADLYRNNEKATHSMTPFKDRIDQENRKIRDYRYRINYNKDKINTMKSPTYQPTLGYMIGTELDKVKPGEYFSQNPIGGPGGQRDKLYSRMSKGVLKAQPFGYAKVQRINPTTWLRDDVPMEWDPGTLKDPAIRKAFGVPKETDVSIYRDRTMFEQPIYQKGGPLSSGKTAVALGSHEFRLPRALSNATLGGLYESIPSAEVIKATGEEGIGAGIKTYASEIMEGLPYMAGLAGATYVVPALASVAPPVLGGLGVYEAGRSVNELSRQTTGETALSKLQQTAGKVAPGVLGKPSTGSAYRYNEDARAKEERLRKIASGELVEPIPQLNAYTPLPISMVTRPQQELDAYRDQQPTASNPLVQRIQLAGKRFNPARGEFGLTELFFGQ
tara:strand:+ start:3789 stop:5978 length:2190 start_codon:yes stop_codon:yes gene_type:complete